VNAAGEMQVDLDLKGNCIRMHGGNPRVAGYVGKRFIGNDPSYVEATVRRSNLSESGVVYLSIGDVVTGAYLFIQSMGASDTPRSWAMTWAGSEAWEDWKWWSPGPVNVDWKAVIRDGGPGRGFSPIMPSFAEALTSQQMDAVIAYLRGFCRDRAWPRGELNLPRPLSTEKAFPEDEVVITTAVNARGPAGIDHELVYERRFGARNQIEVSLPVSFARQDTRTWFGGVGDIGLGVKRALFASYTSILSVQGEVVLPTGNKARGFGSGVTEFETFASYGQLLPRNSFLQMQTGAGLPTHTEDAPRSFFWRAAIGKSFRQGQGVGRLWSPMVEWLDNSFWAINAPCDAMTLISILIAVMPVGIT
jgi:hypothetical protein